MQVSFFPNSWEKLPALHLPIGYVLKQIKEKMWYNHVWRVLQAEEGEDRSKKKRALPAFTPSGTFSKGEDSALIEYSNIVCVDFDKVKQLNYLINKVTALPYTLAAFVSPSRKGLKVLIKIDLNGLELSKDTHKIAYVQAMELYEKETGLNIEADASCKNISRLCYVSFDEDLYYNPTPTPLQIVKPKPVKPKKFQPTLLPAEVASWLIDFTTNKGNYKLGNMNNFLFMLACNCNRYGLDFNEALSLCTDLWQTEPLVKYEAMKRTVQSAYKYTNEHAKFQLPQTLKQYE